MSRIHCIEVGNFNTYRSSSSHYVSWISSLHSEWARPPWLFQFVFVVVTFALLASTPQFASADTVSRLARVLRKSKSPKARVSAVIALARIKDKRVRKPLLAALRDHNRSVRAVAATALGHLGDRRALSALRKATQDPSESVALRAKAAIARILNPPKPKTPPKAARPSSKNLSRMRSDPQEPLNRIETPKMFVAVKSTADKSPGRTRRRLRNRRAKRLHQLFMAELGDSSMVTTELQLADRLGLRIFAIDASITKMSRRVHGSYVEVECEIRLTISNEKGKLLSFLTGGATIRLLRKGFRRKYLSGMRRHALKGAVKNVHHDLLMFLEQSRNS